MDIDVIWLETAALLAALFWAALLLGLFLRRDSLYQRFLKHWNGAQSERAVTLSLVGSSLLFVFCTGMWVWLWQFHEPPEVQIALPAQESIKIDSSNVTIGEGNAGIGIGNTGYIKLPGNKTATGKNVTVKKGPRVQTGKKNQTGKKGPSGANLKGSSATRPTRPTPPAQPSTKQPATDASCVTQGVLSASSDCLDLVVLVKQLSKAPIAYNRPETMYRGEPEQISLVIDPGGTADMKLEMRALKGRVVETQTQTTRRMSAEIAGSLFEIEPAGVQTKTLSPLVPTRWDWRITPQKEGDAPLTLSIYVIFEQGDGRQEAIAIRNYTDPVQVHVHAMDKVGDVVAKAEPIYAFLATVVTGLFGFCVWLIARWRRLKDGANAN